MKNLICITTYKSVDLVKSFIWDYIDFVANNDSYDFILSLDGIDKKTIEYCTKYQIPLLYSEENEGVGISKNRVIKSFDKYDNYFFIEDDIELLNPDVFDIHIKLSQELGIEHFSLFEARRIREQKNILAYGDYHIIQALYGGAPFNFFTKKGLDAVGGFHTNFAKYKRFGHTEHTYRFVNNELSQYPFQLIQECLDGCFRWNDPISRVKLSVKVSVNRLFIEEEKLIEQKLKYFPVKTLSSYKMINKANMNTVKNIIHDDKVVWNKRKFYFKLATIDTLRNIKNILKSLVGR